jgi:hypothetical protein
LPPTRIPSVLRSFLSKILGILLGFFLLACAFLLVLHPFSALVTTRWGGEARVSSVSDHWGRLRTGCRVGGLFKVSLAGDRKPSGPVYCFYPRWPDCLSPLKGDFIRVWPSRQPLLGGPAVDGWGWFLEGISLVLGLLFLEFALLAWTFS